MRDIRNDLRERLAHINGHYADEMVAYDDRRQALETAHRDLISRLDRERAAVQQLLTIEEQRDGQVPSSLHVELVPLADFLITKVHAHGSLTKDDLRAEASAAGYFADGNGRTFHTTLMNMARNRSLWKLADGRYVHPSSELAPKGLFAIGMPVDQSEEGDMRTVM